MKPIPSSEITPHSVYLSRRRLMKGFGAAAITAATASACGESIARKAPLPTPENLATDEQRDELGDSLTDYSAVTGYNNFYEFSISKDAVAPLARDYPTRPWSVEVGGLVNNPGVFDIEDILSDYDQEERIYRLRCVEGWSMVIPWTGFPFRKLLETVVPKSEAKYVRFETVLDPENMRGQQSRVYDWPYVEGLRIDEAMNDLTILATGLYGNALLPQNGAPVRLVVPWKYGFKSIKSIVKIDLVEEMPNSLWMDAAPNEYGFFANVNPQVSHPRWSQSSERRIGEISRRKTLMFNGYADQVAELYKDMDLAKWF